MTPLEVDQTFFLCQIDMKGEGSHLKLLKQFPT